MLVFVTENSFILNRLLALFGERVTTQFMSQALGWADNIIIAMVPLGIVTIIVSAIRVGGPVWLKAIVGRAMENRAAAEVELMSSTSHEVSELWNGQKIVRVAGQAPIVEFICLLSRKDESNGITPQSSEPQNIETAPFEAISLKDAGREGYMECDGLSNPHKTIANSQAIRSEWSFPASTLPLASY